MHRFSQVCIARLRRLGWSAVLAFVLGAPTVRADSILLNELKVNPPGEDIPYEYIEIRGEPGQVCSNLYCLVIEGDEPDDPGVLELQIDLTGARLGSNGYLLVVGEAHPYDPPAETAVLIHPTFSAEGGALENGAISVLLVSSPHPLQEGDDLDHGDNGTLEQVPEGFVILDAVGWTGGRKKDEVYGGARLKQPGSRPDAATRFPGNDTASEADAWFNGDLEDSGGDELLYRHPASDNFIPGSVLTPGRPNLVAPLVEGPAALSGVIGDPTNPGITFTVELFDGASGSLDLTATSDNPAVVPDDHLALTAVGSNTFSLALDPVGVGYAGVFVHADNGVSTGRWDLAYAASESGRDGGTFLTGVSDGSAAVPIDDDWMIVADDEDQVFRLFPRHASGSPVAVFDLESPLNLTDYEDGVPREVDFEGVTRSGDWVYWLGSHSHAEIGELRPNRWRIVTTRLTGAGANAVLEYVGHYEHLRDDLLAWDQTNGHGKGADYYGLSASAASGVIPKEPHGAGFNIEGLTMVPGNPEAAYLCFRAPLVPVTNRARSLVVPVTNFTAMALAGDSPGSAAFGHPFELYLGGRGIRGIEGGPEEGFLITAGPVHNQAAVAPHIYKLFTWSGDPGDSPRERSTDLTLLNPECIVELPPAPWTPTSRVQVISDSGRTVYYNDGEPAKTLPEPAFRKFRSDWVPLGELVEDPQPRIQSFRSDDTALHIDWFAEPGRQYRFQVAWSGVLTEWYPLGPNHIANLPLMSHTFSTLPDTPTAFRIVLLPP